MLHGMGLLLDGLGVDLGRPEDRSQFGPRVRDALAGGLLHRVPGGHLPPTLLTASALPTTL